MLMCNFRHKLLKKKSNRAFFTLAVFTLYAPLTQTFIDITWTSCMCDVNV